MPIKVGILVAWLIVRSEGKKMTMQMDAVGQSIKRILDTIPPGVLLIAAAKTSRLEEVRAAIEEDENLVRIGTKLFGERQ